MQNKHNKKLENENACTQSKQVTSRSHLCCPSTKHQFQFAPAKSADQRASVSKHKHPSYLFPGISRPTNSIFRLDSKLERLNLRKNEAKVIPTTGLDA